MSSVVGRISGQLLNENLERDGVDLSFETDLVYLDVNNQRVGIKTDTPYRTLTVNGTTIVPNIIADTSFSTTGSDRVTLIGNEILNPNGEINLTAAGADPEITAPRIETDGLFLDNNQIGTVRSNESVDFHVTGTGRLNIRSNTEIFGDLHATGDITFDGDITFGDSDEDSVSFSADLASNIIPDADDTYTLGTETKRWSDLYNILVNGIEYTTEEIVVGDANLTLRQGNILYVSVNGNDNNSGTHQNDTFATVYKALQTATAGDTVFIYPGTYEEIFPLEIPAGVTVRGMDIRNTKIVPDSTSANEDVFLLNGETTVEDITIADFYYDPINDKGYAFKFAPGFKVTTRSPYVRNITVLTKGSILTTDDPLGYDQEDAGRGGYFDGSVADPTSREASILFHSVTFITPNAVCLTMTNGVRTEWLNSFIYFAHEGLKAVSGSTGFANDGKTRLRIYGISSETVVAGDTINVENVSDAGTFTSAVIESISYDSPYTDIIIDGKVTGWETSAEPPDTDNQQTITFTNGETASYLANVDYSDFGAEIRSIASANVYGDYGAIADGHGTLMYLINHNFAYIGVGKESDNDESLVIESQQTFTQDEGKIYFQSVDHTGIFKVGDVFRVDSETGQVTFAAQSIDLSGLTFLEFIDGDETTRIDASQTTTGNIQITENTIYSLTSTIELSPQNDELNVNSDLSVSNNLQLINDLFVQGNTTFGADTADIVTWNPELDQSLIPISNKTYNLGSDTNRWKTVWLNQLNLDDIVISSSTIQTTLSNSDLSFQANGTGVIRLEGLNFSNGTISANQINSNIEITTDGLGQTKITGSNALVLPKGSSANRTLSLPGEMRYNNSYNTVEGYTLTGLKDLAVVRDSDRNTYILPESSPGASNNVIDFYANSVKTAYLSESALTAIRFIVDDLEINNRKIQTITTNADLNFDPNGTGAVVIKGFRISNNTIENTNTDTATTITHAGNGYVKFVGGALQIPHGGDSDRTNFPGGTPELGAHRWNTDRGYLEVWNGTAWQIATGEGEAVTGDIMSEFTDVYALILG